MRILYLLLIIPLSCFAHPTELELVYNDHLNDVTDIHRFYFYKYFDSNFEKYKIFRKEYPKDRVEKLLDFYSKYNFSKHSRKDACTINEKYDPKKPEKWRENIEVFKIDLHEKPDNTSPVTGYYYVEDLHKEPGSGGTRYLIVNGKPIDPLKADDPLCDSRQRDKFGLDKSATSLIENGKGYFVSYQPVLDYKVTKDDKGNELEWMRLPSYGTGKALWLSSQYLWPFDRARYPLSMRWPNYPGQKTLYRDVAAPFGLYSLSKTRFFDTDFCFEKLENGVIHIKRRLIEEVGSIELGQGQEQGMDDEDDRLEKRRHVADRQPLLDAYAKDTKNYPDLIYKIKFSDFIKHKSSLPWKTINFMLDQIAYEPDQNRSCGHPYFYKAIPLEARRKIYSKHSAVIGAASGGYGTTAPRSETRLLLDWEKRFIEIYPEINLDLNNSFEEFKKIERIEP